MRLRAAGSVTSVLCAQVLLEAKDPVTLMYQAWVVQDSFDAMRERSHDYPLDSESLATLARTVLGMSAPSTVKVEVSQKTPIRASMSVTSLAGLTYRLRDRPGAAGIPVATYQDWIDVDFTPGQEDWVTPTNAALASAANVMGFRARRIDRSDEVGQYANAGLEGFPSNEKFWYTDGGTTSNEPLGRTIDLTADDSDDDTRLLLLVHYDAGPTPAGQDSPWPQRHPASPAVMPSASRGLETELLGLLRSSAGLHGRREVAVELVSPAIDATNQQRCAGAFLFHFGGFFDVKLRHNDFALGYRNMTRWLTDRLEQVIQGSGNDASLHRKVEAALAEVQNAPARANPAVPIHPGAAPDRSLRDKWDVALFVKQIVEVIACDVIHGEL